MRIVSSIVGATAACGIATVMVISFPTRPATALQPAVSAGSASPGQAPPTQTPNARRRSTSTLLADLGLSAETLCACGATPAQIAAVVGNADAFASNYLVPLRASHEAIESSRRALDRSSQTHSAPGSSTQSASSGASRVAALTAARSNHASALQQRATLLQSAFDTTTSGMPPELTARLAKVRANRARMLPIHLLVVDRSETEWVALRQAMEHSAARQRVNREPEPSAARTLALALANTEVAAARQRVSQGRAEAEAAFRAAVASIAAD